MAYERAFSTDPTLWLTRHAPDEPVFFFAPAVLHATARRFVTGFPGLVTYAVKANPDRVVLDTLVEAGIAAFDVASVEEMEMVRLAKADAVLHYHNPIRSTAEIVAAKAIGVASWSVDRMGELDKLGDIAGREIAVRLRLPVKGAAYDFGTKFGADPEAAKAMLQAVVARGGIASMTFHPGTQCDDAEPWARYIEACGDIAKATGIRLHRLNVGGGFAAHRGGAAPDLEAVFARIHAVAQAAFDGDAPALVCEPGRAMVSEAWQLALRVKSLDDASVFLNDGIYGGLSEWRDLSAGDRITVIGPDGMIRKGAPIARVLFGPTCDSVDRLPEPLALPGDIADDDHVLFDAMGAYSGATATRFNGYGARRVVTLAPIG